MLRNERLQLFQDLKGGRLRCCGHGEGEKKNRRTTLNFKNQLLRFPFFFLPSLLALPFSWTRVVPFCFCIPKTGVFREWLLPPMFFLLQKREFGQLHLFFPSFFLYRRSDAILVGRRWGAKQLLDLHILRPSFPKIYKNPPFGCTAPSTEQQQYGK